jgi:UPF0755 protein
MRKVLVLAFLVLIVAGAAAAWYAGAVWQRLHEPYKGYEAAEQFVEIPPGTSTAEIRRRLIAAGVVRDEIVFRSALWWTGRAQDLQAGEYRFDRPIAAVDVVDRIARGDVYRRPITFPEGLTIPDMARIFESSELGSAASFVEAAGNASLIADLDPEAGDLEGYLFPETYTLPRGTTASRLVELMVQRFRLVYTDALRESAEAQGLTTRQVVTVASLIEKETARAEERALVAAVYRNRMRIGMPMQADPTVVYAMQQAGIYEGNIRRQDLQIDSPYNTYRYPGLPPGPIAAPGQASIEAALAPADVSYLYFVSRNDGSHVFADTLAQHNRNVREYQILFFRRGGQQGGQ